MSETATLVWCPECERFWDLEEAVYLADAATLKSAAGCPVCKGACKPYPSDEDEFSEYVDVCPLCDRGIKLVAYTASCDIPVQRDGWAFSDGPCDSSDEKFACSEHGEIPAEWVFLRLSRREAARQMDHLQKNREKARRA